MIVWSRYVLPTFYRLVHDCKSAYLFTYAKCFSFRKIKMDLYFTFVWWNIFPIDSLMSHFYRGPSLAFSSPYFDQRFGTHVMTTSRFRLLSLQLVLFLLFYISRKFNDLNIYTYQTQPLTNYSILFWFIPPFST